MLAWRALVEAGVERIGNRLAVDEIDQNCRRAMAHLERPLADLRVAATRLQRGQLRRQSVARNDDQLLRLQLGHYLVGHLRIGLRAELRPAADEDERIEIRVLREHVGHLLVREVDLIVREQRTAVDLLPAAFTLQAIDTLLAADGVAKAGRARVDVVGSDVAELQAYRPTLGLQLLQMLGHQNAHVVVVGAEIRLAQRAIRRREIGVDRHDRHLRVLRLQHLAHRRGVRRRDGDAGDALVDQVLDDLHFAGLVGARGRAGIQAGVLGFWILLVPERAAIAQHRKERVVQSLYDHGKRLFLRHRRTGTGKRHQRRREGHENRLVHFASLSIC